MKRTARQLSVRVTIGDRLRLHRLAACATLRQVEEATGLSNAVINQIETGKVRNPGVWTVAKLAAYYGTTIDRLMEGVTEGGES